MPVFAQKLYQQFTDKGYTDKGLEDSRSFVGMVFGIFPMLPLLFYNAMKEKKEDQIYQLSKSMGLKPKSIFCTYVVMQNILVLISSSIIFVIMKIMFFPNGAIEIIFLYMVININVVMV